MPLVFREKVKWRLPEWDETFVSSEANYTSADLEADEVESKMKVVTVNGQALDVDYVAWGGAPGTTALRRSPGYANVEQMK